MRLQTGQSNHIFGRLENIHYRSEPFRWILKGEQLLIKPRVERDGILNESTNLAKHGGKGLSDGRTRKGFVWMRFQVAIYVTGEEVAKLTGQNVKALCTKKMLKQNNELNKCG